MVRFMLVLSCFLWDASAYDYAYDQGFPDYHDYGTSPHSDYHDAGDYGSHTSNYGDHETSTSDYGDPDTSTSGYVTGTSSDLVTCDSNALEVCSSNTNTCEKLLRQGSCHDGYWLLATGTNGKRGEVTCTKRKCSAGMYFHPGSHTCKPPVALTCEGKRVPAVTLQGNIECHCPIGTVLYKDKCYQPYSKGPCGGKKKYLGVTKENEVKCMVNKCGKGKYYWVKFNNVCYQLNQRGPCKIGETLQANAATSFSPACLPAGMSRAVTNSPTVCSNGRYADHNGNCKEGFSIIYISYFRRGSVATVKKGRCQVDATTGGYHGASGEHHGRSGEHHGRSGEHHGRSGEHHGKSGEHHGWSGEHQGRSGEYHGKSGEHHGGSGEHHGKSGKHHGGSGKHHGKSGGRHG